MKKLSFLVVLALLVINVKADNYKNAFGVTLGWSTVDVAYGVNFKHFTSDRATAAVDLNFCFQGDDMFTNAFFELHKESRKSSRQIDYLSYYVGPGFVTRFVNSTHRATSKGALLFAPAVILGLEFTIPKSKFLVGFNAIPMYNIGDMSNYWIGFDNLYGDEFIQLDARIRYCF